MLRHGQHGDGALAVHQPGSKVGAVTAEIGQSAAAVEQSLEKENRERELLAAGMPIDEVYTRFVVL